MGGVASDNWPHEEAVLSKRKKLKKQEWGIVVRKNDGGILYYCLSAGRQGQECWSHRENEAVRFGSQDAADSLSKTFSTNAVAWEYRVVRISMEIHAKRSSGVA